MSRNFILYLICIGCLPSCVYAQLAKFRKIVPFDSNYIRTYPKVFALYLPLTAPYLKLVFRDYKTGNKLNFQPTKQFDLGIGLNYRGLNLIVGTGISLFKENEIKQGKTKYTDIQVHYMPRRFANDIYYQKYKGFYIKNSRDFGAYQSSTDYQIRPDLSSNLVVFNSNYIFNYKQFSFKNAFGFNETQLKSAGSPLVGAYYSLFNISTDSAIVSNPFTQYFSSDGTIKKSTEQTLGINIGYIYTRVILNNFHATVMLLQGGGIYKMNYTLTDNSDHSGKINIGGKTNLRLSFRYDSGKIFVGAMSIYDNYYFNGSSSSLFNFGNGKVRIFAGYRFGKGELNIIKDKITNEISPIQN